MGPTTALRCPLSGQSPPGTAVPLTHCPTPPLARSSAAARWISAAVESGGVEELTCRGLDPRAVRTPRTPSHSFPSDACAVTTDCGTSSLCTVRARCLLDLAPLVSLQPPPHLAEIRSRTAGEQTRWRPPSRSGRQLSSRDRSTQASTERASTTGGSTNQLTQQPTRSSRLPFTASRAPVQRGAAQHVLPAADRSRSQGPVCGLAGGRCCGRRSLGETQLGENLPPSMCRIVASIQCSVFSVPCVCV